MQRGQSRRLLQLGPLAGESRNFSQPLGDEGGGNPDAREWAQGLENHENATYRRAIAAAFEQAIDHVAIVREGYTSRMSNIAVLGTGLLGAGFVESFLTKGHTVRVWNRTAGKAAALGAKGAIVAADPTDAVRGASHVHLVLSEDDAVDAVIAALRPGLGKGVPIIDHSTNLPAKVAARVAKLRSESLNYVPAPVFMSPQNAREASGMMVISCPKADADALSGHLTAMTGKLIHAGERPELAAVWKLAGNSIFFALAAAMSDVFAIGKGCDVDVATMLHLFDSFMPGSGLQFIGQRVAKSGDGPVNFELTMARKDARLMQQAAGSSPTLLLPAVAVAMDKAIARGDGRRDFAVFTRA